MHYRIYNSLIIQKCYKNMNNMSIILNFIECFNVFITCDIMSENSIYIYFCSGQGTNDMALSVHHIGG